MRTAVRPARITAFLGIALLAVLAALPHSARADDALEAQSLVAKARFTFDAFMEDPGMSWLREHLREARGVLIVPQMLKGGFILGASGGSAVLTVLDPKSGQGSEPAFYHIGSVSFGLQIGASAAEMVMLIMTDRAVDSLLSSRFKLGGDISAAMGPVGAGASAKGIAADIIAFARAKGAYIGISLEGAYVDTADALNHAYYGRAAAPADILVKREASNPKSAELREALERALQRAAAAGKEAPRETDGQMRAKETEGRPATDQGTVSPPAPENSVAPGDADASRERKVFGRPLTGEGSPARGENSQNGREVITDDHPSAPIRPAAGQPEKGRE